MSAEIDALQRLFVAITLPNAVREILAALPEKILGVHWSPAEQWHLTLRFIGDVAAEKCDALRERLGAVVVEPFVLPIEGVGTFPPGRPPRVVWVGTGSGHPRLFQLRQRVDDAILASGLDPDMRSFHPHVTLGRCTGPQSPGLVQWLQRHREFAGPSIRVEAFDLYRSELRPAGAIHTLVESFGLGGRS